MSVRIEELIRLKAFELSQLPDRIHSSDVENWLDAERIVGMGLAEDEAGYDADTQPTITPATADDGATIGVRMRNGRSTRAG